jgi:hypothetical protein
MRPGIGSEQGPRVWSLTVWVGLTVQAGALTFQVWTLGVDAVSMVWPQAKVADGGSPWVGVSAGHRDVVKVGCAPSALLVAAMWRKGW